MTSFEIELTKVVVCQSLNCFVVVQCQYDNPQYKTQKYRTEISTMNNRYDFKKNVFTFKHLCSKQVIKFALMRCFSHEESKQNINQAVVKGMTSIRISQDILMQNHIFENNLHFVDSNKLDVGLFHIKITLLNHEHSNNQHPNNQHPNQKINDKENKHSNLLLISRILYTEEASKDQLKMENNIKMLEKEAEKLYKEFHSSKNTEEELQSLYQNLIIDEENIKNQISAYENLNQKISQKMYIKESLENLSLETQMLKNTKEGRQLLLEKLEYFQERIQNQDKEFSSLKDKYQRIKNTIQHNLLQTELFAEKLKGKQLQQFEIKNNTEILQNFQNIEYEFRCNNKIIENFKNKSKNSKQQEWTEKQAQLLLSQVKYEIQLQKYAKNHEQQQQILRSIQKQSNKYPQQKLSPEEEHVYRIKLDALEKKVEEIRDKIKKLNQVAEIRQIKRSKVENHQRKKYETLDQSIVVERF